MVKVVHSAKKTPQNKTRDNQLAMEESTLATRFPSGLCWDARACHNAPALDAEETQQSEGKMITIRRNELLLTERRKELVGDAGFSIKDKTREASTKWEQVMG